MNDDSGGTEAMKSRRGIGVWTARGMPGSECVCVR